MKQFLNFMILPLFLLIGCGSDDSVTNPQPENTIRVKGVLDANLSISKGIGDIGDISVIIAAALDRFGHHDSEDVVRVPIELDGSFEIDLPIDFDWVLMTEDPDALLPEDRFGNFISISEDIDTRLSVLPMSNATENIDLGVLTANGDETDSTTSLSDLESSLGFTLAELLEQSRVDVLAKYVKNTQLNTDVQAGISFDYQLQYYYYSENNLTYNTYSNPTPVAIDLTPSFRIYPIFPSLIDEANFSMQTPNGVTALLPPYGALENGELGYNITNGIETGYYKLLDANGTEIALFDLAGVDITTNNTDLSAILPSIRLNVDNNTTTSFSLKFFSYDEFSDSYLQITDSTLMTRYLKNMDIYFYNNDIAVGYEDNHKVAFDFQDGNYTSYDFNASTDDNVSSRSPLVINPLDLVNGEITVDFINQLTNLPDDIFIIHIYTYTEGGIRVQSSYNPLVP